MAFRSSEIPTNFGIELRQVLRERNLVSSREKVSAWLNGGILDDSLPNSSSAHGVTKVNDHRSQAVLEIINSEKTYLGQLEMLMEFFVLPLKKLNIIDLSSHTLLFGQIEMIHNLNGEFLRKLEADMKNVVHAFLEMAPFFKLYSVYAFDYRKALLLLQDLTSKNADFRKFLEQTESRPEVQRKLISLLIVPIQRVPRYKLLLQQLLDYTSPADPQHKLLKESIKLIENTVSHINSCVEDQEVTQILINLQNSLYNRTPNIVQPSRKVIKEGILQKVTRHGIGIPRYCVLMSDIFMYCKILKERTANTPVENSLQCCCIFPLNKCKVYELLPGNFKITCQGDGIIFSTIDLQVQRTWVNLTRDAIELHLQCRKTLRKESSKRKPMRKKDVKKFGTDYVLSPNKRKCEYETVFRNKDCSSDSECSYSSAVGYPRFLLCCSKGPEDTCSMNQRRALKRTATSLLQANQKFNQHHNQVGILKSRASKRLTQIGHNSHNDFDPSYGFASRYSDTKTYFRAHNVDNTLPTAQREAILNHYQTNGMVSKALETDDNDSEYAILASQKKRVKFDVSQNNFLSNHIEYTRTTTTSAEKTIPLYKKAWQFLTNWF